MRPLPKELKLYSFFAVWLISAFSLASTALAQAAGTAASDNAAVILPARFHPDVIPASLQPTDWVLVSHLWKDSTSADKRDLYDFSALQPVDPCCGLLAAPVFNQWIFVPARAVSTVKANRNNWTEQYVVQTIVLPGQAHFSRRTYDLFVIEDIDRQICHQGVQRKLLSLTPSEMVYESKFTNCPKDLPPRFAVRSDPLGPDRNVFTRYMIMPTSWGTGTMQIYFFSYEVSGRDVSDAQREEGMKLISEPHVAVPGEQGPRLSDSNFSFQGGSALP